MALTRAEITMKLLSLLFVVTGFTLISMIIVEVSGGTERLAVWVENAGPWAPIVYLVLKASTYIFAPLSGASIELASGALFGVWMGTLLSLLGSTIGGMANYWIARTLGRTGIVKFAGKKSLTQVDHATKHVANWRILLGARLVLSPIYDFVSYAAGLTRIPFIQYVLVSFLGGMPIALFFPLIGHTSISSNSGSYILISINAVLFLGLGTYLLYNKRKQTRQTAENE